MKSLIAMSPLNNMFLQFWRTCISRFLHFNLVPGLVLVLTVCPAALTAADVGTAPLLGYINDVTVNEGETVFINPMGTDPDDDVLTFSYSGWMTSDTYKTNYTDAGVYTVTVTVSDGSLTASQNVTVTVINSPQTTLSWTANTEADIAGYKVYYGKTSGNYDANVDVGNQTNYTLTGLINGHTYHLAVTAYDSSGNESAFSSEVIFTVLVVIDSDGDGVADSQDAFPSDPNEWIDTDADGIGDNADLDTYNEGQFALSWTANTESDLAGYKVYYGNTSGNYDANVDVGNQTNYTLTGLVNGQTYYVAVTAYDSSGNESAFSSEVIYSVLVINDPDVDGDGVADSQDAFPSDPNEWSDHDSDGIGNNADTDDDNDGMSDTWEIANGLDPLDNGSVNVQNGPDGDIDGDGSLNMLEYESYAKTDNTVNQAPVLSTMTQIITNEGAAITLKPIAVDPDGDTLTYTYSGWMVSKNYTTNYNDAGTHIVTVTVSDGMLTDSQDVSITVVNSNRPPVLDPITQ
ncbi:MAG: fibronectin type III domain-containing protein [Candidatus Scalindua rubra]|uniref:Fibronectin type-III domain-containing protein n=1 Tax=Candidatus Scalindua brodae TaxID=237368 RepID=A0A0B0EC65_9BACT|nr:MAG: hypothetical protein SCABRO_04002 [Candidatus Scalindua brodae]MBZ0109707.1 fibronectin type III domain-containing protein [Candidatus Scalindua rubra]TWU32422.1 Exoglucanase B precursor [Candidatus Brocadiaceae bacterium S225]